jgi:nucleotide-binding universal stress UspA family protein
MKKVLIALDYNPGAQRIAETGYELSKALKAQTILLHVTSAATYYSSLNYSPIVGFDSSSNLDVVQTDSIEKVKGLAQRYLDKSKRLLCDEAIQTVVKEGDFGETILQTAKELKVDIIVIGTHKHKRLDKILMGSIAERVLQHTEIPLLIIPLNRPN